MLVGDRDGRVWHGKAMLTSHHALYIFQEYCPIWLLRPAPLRKCWTFYCRQLHISLCSCTCSAIIFSRCNDEHFNNIRTVLDLLKRAGRAWNLKTFLLQGLINYLWYISDHERIDTLSKATNAVCRLYCTTNASDRRVLLDFAAH